MKGVRDKLIKMKKRWGWLIRRSIKYRAIMLDFFIIFLMILYDFSYVFSLYFIINWS